MKIISFNIKQISYYNVSDSKKNIDIRELLAKQDADIICLQETEEEQVLSYVAFLNSKTGDEYDYVYDMHNAIISRIKIIDKSTKKITVADCYLSRGIIKITIEYNNLPIIIIATHLDHLSEEIRLKQIEEVQSDLKTAHILVGDLNSLKFDDYTSDYLYAIDLIRKDNRIESTKNHVINTIESFGFRTTPFKSQTCPYGTRIDYVYIKYDFICKYIESVDDSIINCIRPDLTDHNMVINDIMFKDSLKNIANELMNKLNIKNR